MATTNKDLAVPAHGSFVNDWDVPVNQNWSQIDAAFGGSTALNVTGQSGIIALTPTQYIPPNLLIIGTLTAAVNYQVPSGAGGIWSISNTATGAFTVQFSCAAGGSAITVPQGGTRTLVIGDGTSVGIALASPIVAGGLSLEIQYNASGVLAGSTNMTFDGTNLNVAGLNGPVGTVTPAAANFTAINATGAVALAGASSVTVPTESVGTNTTNAASTAFVANNSAVFANAATFTAATGTANAITATYSPAVAGLVDGLSLNVRITTANTSTAVTFSPNGFPAHAVVNSAGQNPAIGELRVNTIAQFTYSVMSTAWLWTNSGSAAQNVSGTFATGTATDPLGTIGITGSRNTAGGTIINWATIQLEDGGNGTSTNPATFTYAQPFTTAVTGVRNTNLSYFSGQTANNAGSAVLTPYSLGLSSASLGVHGTTAGGTKVYMYVEIEGY